MIKTKITTLLGDMFDDIKIREAAEYIKNGKLVIFPTETVYGLGANALDMSAVEKIYAAKGRQRDNPLIVHLHDRVEINKYAYLNRTAEILLDRFSPSPLTLVLNKKNVITDEFTSGLPTVAIRIPANETARKLIKYAGVPIAAPSANLSGKPSPTVAQHIIEDMDGRVDMILCGGDAEIGLESTVISFDSGDRISILRDGFITAEMLADTVGMEYMASENQYNDEKPRAPGMKYKHYAPDAPMYVLSGGNSEVLSFILNAKNSGKKTGVLCFSEIYGEIKKQTENNNLFYVEDFGGESDYITQGKRFYGALSYFNSRKVDVIYAQKPSEYGFGAAVCNRLMKACGGNVIYL